MTKKSLTYLIIALAVVGLGSAAALTVKAEANRVEGSSYPPIMERFVEYFDIDESDAQEFLEQEHQTRQEMMQARFEQGLDAAIDEGELTQEQKELILAKKEEMRAKMQEMQEEMQAWAEENNIDLKFLRCGKGPGRGFGRGRGFRPGCLEE